MFDIGFSELLLIAVVALVVLGPERLPKAARFAGLWVRRARAQWDSVKQELERELEAEELKRNLHSVQQSLRDAQTQLRQGEQHVQAQGQRFHDEVTRDIDVRSGHELPVADTAPVVHPAVESPVAESPVVEAPAAPPAAGLSERNGDPERQP